MCSVSSTKLSVLGKKAKCGWCPAASWWARAYQRKSFVASGRCHVNSGTRTTPHEPRLPFPNDCSVEIWFFLLSRLTSRPTTFFVVCCPPPIAFRSPPLSSTFYHSRLPLPLSPGLDSPARVYRHRVSTPRCIRLLISDARLETGAADYYNHLIPNGHHHHHMPYCRACFSLFVQAGWNRWSLKIGKTVAMCTRHGVKPWASERRNYQQAVKTKTCPTDKYIAHDTENVSHIFSDSQGTLFVLCTEIFWLSLSSLFR